MTSLPPSTPRGRIRPLTLLPVLLLLGVAALAGCATREETPRAAAGSGGFPVTFPQPGGGEVTIDERPERIVSLSAPATEMLYAVGAGEQVVAVDEQSNYPADVPKTELSGLTPSPEAIAGHDPDLVMVSGDVDQISEALAKTGVQTVVLPAAKTLEEAYRQFELVGQATGHAPDGKELARRTEAEIAKIVADTPRPEKALTYYHELDQTYYSATSATFIGEVYGLFGLENIADGDDPDALGGYPQLSAERILSADPDLIFLADTKCCGQNLGTVAQLPGWQTLTAVKQRQVIELDDDIASRWSPRIVDLVRAVSDAVADATE